MGRGSGWQCPASGSKSVEKADPIGSPTDLDEVLAGKLQQIGACRIRVRFGEEAWDQRCPGTQPNISNPSMSRPESQTWIQIPALPLSSCVS